MPPTFRQDPYSVFNFQVVIHGVSEDGSSAKGAFSEVSGLGVDIDVIEYRTGTEDIGVRKLPGLKRYPNIVLKRGIIGDDTMWEWISKAMNGEVQRADGHIALLDEHREEVMRWNFRRAWPCGWSGPNLNALHSEIAIETLEICHEGLELDQ